MTHQSRPNVNLNSRSVPCTAGQYWSVSEKMCEECEDGSVSEAGATECQSCPAGITTNNKNLEQCGNYIL